MALWVAAVLLVAVVLGLVWLWIGDRRANKLSGELDGATAIALNGKYDDNSQDERQLAEMMEFAGEGWRSALYGDQMGDEDRRILVVYATEYGFSKEVARAVAERLSHAEVSPSTVVRPRVVNVADLDLVDWTQEEFIMWICSTTGDGVVPNDARGVYEDWTSLAEAQTEMRHKVPCISDAAHFAVLALGDQSYPHFCRAGILFEELFQKLTGHSPLAARVDVDQEDWDAINRWIDTVVHAVSNSPSRTSPPQNGQQNDYLINSVIGKSSSINNDRASRALFSRDNPLLAPMTKCKPLTSIMESSIDKETVLVEFDVGGSGFQFTPGDALGVIPVNCLDQVEQILIALAADADTLVSVPSSAANSTNLAASATLSDVLAKHCDLHQVKPDLVLWLASNCTDPEERALAEKLLHQSKKSKVMSDYLRDRHLIDVLEDFNSALPGPDLLVQYLRPLTARYYSISSSQRKNATTVATTVAVVKYDTLGRSRSGVASCFLRERLALGQSVQIFLSRNNDFRLPSDPATPIIMIGPGTGIAPFRAFLQERAMDRLEGRRCGEQLLFFGCRQREKDFLFEDELLQEEKAGNLTLYTAFSREDPSEKVYVQHRICQHGEFVWSLLERGAHLYVCGDATRMAGDVNNAILQVIETHGEQTTSEAEAWLDNLSKLHRYQRDVWAS